jgi:hypothetical protein
MEEFKKQENEPIDAYIDRINSITGGDDAWRSRLLLAEVLRYLDKLLKVGLKKKSKIIN